MLAKDYWNERYASGGNSGYGSYGEQLKKKLDWLKGLPIKSITELGCGDFNFGSNLLKMYPDAKYTGYDISDAVIQRNRNLFPDVDFRVLDFEFKPADLVLCVDVLFHILSDEEYDNTLDLLERTMWKYLAVTAHEEEHTASPHLNIRKFDYKRFGEPLIREIVEEDGQMYFYLFKR